MKRIVLFVEGEGESDAVPRLVKRLLTEQNAWDVVSLDDNTFRVGEVTMESLAGKRLPDGRVVGADAATPSGDLEEAPRNAKGWFADIVEGGYKPTRDQAALTDLVNLDVIRGRRLRSFKRLESALAELISAIRDNKHVVTPS